MLSLLLLSLTYGSALAARKPAPPAKDANNHQTPAPDAQWTIYCTSLSGPTHVEQAKNLKEWLMKNSQLRGWYVIHGDRESTIYHGFYGQRMMRKHSVWDDASSRSLTCGQAVAIIVILVGGGAFATWLFCHGR